MQVLEIKGEDRCDSRLKADTPARLKPLLNAGLETRATGMATLD